MGGCYCTRLATALLAPWRPRPFSYMFMPRSARSPHVHAYALWRPRPFSHMFRPRSARAPFALGISAKPKRLSLGLKPKPKRISLNLSLLYLAFILITVNWAKLGWLWHRKP